MLRHSCNSQTVLTYIREAHISAATDLAEQAWLAKDMGTVRAELRLLQNQAASLKELLENNKASSPGGALLPLLDIEDIEDLEGGVCSNSSLTSEAAPASEDLNVTVNLAYIVSRPLHGKHGSSVG